MSIRQKVIESFDIGHKYAFSNEIPFKYNNYIDGMFHVSMLAGASRIAKDYELMVMCEEYVDNLLAVGNDARNFAPMMVSDSWIPSSKFDGYWYKEKEQSFAGPAMLQWSSDKGVEYKTKMNKKPMAVLLALIAPIFGILIRFIPKLRQHINSVMLAHLLLGIKPPVTMEFLAEDNMIYSYLYKKKCTVLYDNTGIWPAKDYDDESIKEQEYTPICNLIGIYLQESINADFNINS